MDISKCANESCPIKHQCYRRTAPTGARQSYIAGVYDEETKECKDFWNNKDRK